MKIWQKWLAVHHCQGKGCIPLLLPKVFLDHHFNKYLGNK
jgi:hypothetical protein